MGNVVLINHCFYFNNTRIGNAEDAIAMLGDLVDLISEEGYNVTTYIEPLGISGHQQIRRFAVEDGI